MSGKVFNKQVSLITATIVLIALNTFATEKPEVKALLADSLRIYNEVEQIKTQKKETVKELDEKRNTLRLKINLLQDSVFDEERRQHYKDNIVSAENQIAIHKAAIEFAKIADPDKRVELVQKYENQRKKILTEELRAAKPFGKRIDALEKETEGKQKIFEEVMKEYFCWPKKDYPVIVRTGIRARYHAGTVTYEWWDAEHKHQAFCSAQIKLTDSLSPRKDAEMLNDTFYVASLWPQSIEVRAGYFSIRFNMRDPDLWGEEKMCQYIRAFIDLERLAKMNPTASNEPTDDLFRKSIACSKRYRKIINEKKDVVKPLTTERVKVKTLKARLKKPPADSEQIRKDRDQIDFWAKECQSYRTRLEIGTLENPAERTALLKTLQTDKEKLDAEKMSIEKPYNNKIDTLTRGLKDKDSLLNDAMKVYFRTEPDGFEDLNETMTNASFSKARVSCSWKDENGDTDCTAMFFLRNPPTIPDNPKMLDNRYYVNMGGGEKDFIWLWVGNINVYFEVKDENKKWLKTQPINQLVKEFIHLEALGKVSEF